MPYRVVPRQRYTVILLLFFFHFFVKQVDCYGVKPEHHLNKQQLISHT